MVSHSHGHGAAFDEPSRPTLTRALTGVVVFIAVAAFAAMLALWPDDSEVPKGSNPYSGQGVSTVNATVSEVESFDCGSSGFGPDDIPMVQGDCATVTAELDDGGNAEFTLDPTRYVGADMSEGDKVRLVAYETDGQGVVYEFRDFQRGLPLLMLAIAFAVLVTVVGRLRGLLALGGIVVTLWALTQFVLPALLAGKSPLAVAVVGSTVIMIAVLYLAHGISIRTTSALFGTLFGIAFTALAGLLATDWSSLTGIGSEDDHLLVATAPAMSLSGVVAASMVIAGLGVLNDVTVTQASAVWEMRALQPRANRTELFTSAMRIGRDHIASSVYTLVFAYAGSAMTVMLLITAYQRGFVEIVTSEEIAQEVVRTLIGAIGLVLAVPATTGFAIWLAPPAVTEPEGSHAR